MHLCYLDESGTSSIPGNTSHFVLAGISIPVTRWKSCDTEIVRLKNKYALANAEIHTAWLLRRYLGQSKVNDFEGLDYHQRRTAVNQFRNRELLRLQHSKPKLYKQIKKNYKKTEAYIHLTESERRKLLIDLTEIVGNWEFARIFAECIDKIHFDLSFGTSVDEQSFEQVVSRFEQYLQITSPQGDSNWGMLIHDNNPTVAKNLTNLMKKFHSKGTLWTNISNIIETPYSLIVN